MIRRNYIVLAVLSAFFAVAFIIADMLPAGAMCAMCAWYAAASSAAPPGGVA